mgnify:FL=1
MQDKSRRYLRYSFLWMCLFFLNRGHLELNAQGINKEKLLISILKETSIDSIQKSKLLLSKFYIKAGQLDSSKFYFQSIDSTKLKSPVNKGLFKDVKGLILI